MTDKYFFPSLTRISDLREKPFHVRTLAREHWATSDYVAVEVLLAAHATCPLELDNGRMIQIFSGDSFVGALGKRSATLESVGDWEAIETSEDSFHAMTSAGLLGKVTSRSPFGLTCVPVRYRGHVMRGGDKVSMLDFVPKAENKAGGGLPPVFLLVGTSMSAGKTITGCFLVHELKRLGLRVAATKLTGAGRYKDILAFQDAGADHVLDFVDAGLPSTVHPEAEYRTAVRGLLGRITDLKVDALVVEAGASPLEPYNGAIACEELRPYVRFTVLAASDPYAVLGVQRAFDIPMHLVTGPTTNTSAGIALVERLTGLRALSLLNDEGPAVLRQMLLERLQLS